jgi:hypothetical protein
MDKPVNISSRISQQAGKLLDKECDQKDRPRSYLIREIIYKHFGIKTREDK